MKAFVRLAAVLLAAAACSSQPRTDEQQAAAPAAEAAAPAATPAAEGFDATGPLPCAMADDQPLAPQCQFGVNREGNGNGSVTITKPDGSKRVIFFQKGQPTGYDQSQADTGQFKAARGPDVSMVWIGSERYEIPDAVILGG